MVIDSEESDGKPRQLRQSSTFDKIDIQTKKEILVPQNKCAEPTTQLSLPRVSFSSAKQQKQQRLTLKILSRCLKKQQQKRQQHTVPTATSSKSAVVFTNFSPLLSTSTKCIPRKCRYQNTTISHSKFVPSPIIHVSPSPSAPAKKVLIGHCCKIVKRKRRSRIRRVKRQEYNKLREMVPALQEKNKVSKVVVIEEAIKYIDELHSALVQRFRARDVPTTFNGVYLDPREVDGRNIRDLVRRLLANANPGSLPPARIENVRTTPSFLQKQPKHKKT